MLATDRMARRPLYSVVADKARVRIDARFRSRFPSSLTPIDRQAIYD